MVTIASISTYTYSISAFRPWVGLWTLSENPIRKKEELLKITNKSEETSQIDTEIRTVFMRA
jgi:hypothetical protein